MVTLGSLIAAAIFLTTNAQNVRAQQWSTAANGNDIYKTNTAGNVGIGTTAPDGKFVVSSNTATLPSSSGLVRFAEADGVQTSVFVDAFNINGGYLLRRANTSAASPSAVQSNDLLGVLGASGYGTSAYSGTRARIGFGASENWTNSANGTFMTFNTTANGAATPGGTERMRIDNFGNVGIGTTSPGTLVGGLSLTGTIFQVRNNNSHAQLLLSAGAAGFVPDIKMENSDATATKRVFEALYDGANNLAKWRFANESTGAITQDNVLVLRNNGNVGIGIAPAYKLDVSGIVNATGLNVNGSPVNSSQWATSGTTITYASGNVGIGTPTPNSNFTLDVNGKTNVTGDLNATGTITGGNIVAKYQDVAEWVSSSEQIATGTVVVLDQTKSNQVITSTEAYDMRVAGVVSEQPGIALGESGADKVLVATTGRVLVKVDATNGPIHIGDLLVTSDIPGAAMKSEPFKVGGRLIHTPGTLIGKALEPLQKGSGKILVLLSLQ